MISAELCFDVSDVFAHKSQFAIDLFNCGTDGLDTLKEVLRLRFELEMQAIAHAIELFSELVTKLGELLIDPLEPLIDPLESLLHRHEDFVLLFHRRPRLPRSF